WSAGLLAAPRDKELRQQWETLCTKIPANLCADAQAWRQEQLWLPLSLPEIAAGFLLTLFVTSCYAAFLWVRSRALWSSPFFLLVLGLSLFLLGLFCERLRRYEPIRTVVVPEASAY